MNPFKTWFGAGRQKPGHMTQDRSRGPAPAPAEVVQSDAATKPSFATRAGQSITYDAHLMPALLQDHQELVLLFQEVKNHAIAGNTKAAGQALQVFRSRLTEHLLIENTRLYVYLKRTLETDEPESAALAKSFQREVHQIAQALIGFVEKYTADHEQALAEPTFILELNTIGDALSARIQREEAALYPLYAPR